MVQFFGQIGQDQIKEKQDQLLFNLKKSQKNNKKNGDIWGKIRKSLMPNYRLSQMPQKEA